MSYILKTKVEYLQICLCNSRGHFNVILMAKNTRLKYFVLIDQLKYLKNVRIFVTLVFRQTVARKYNHAQARRFIKIDYNINTTKYY